MATVLIIGASRGIGLEFVRQCRAAGDRVVATARSEAGLALLQAEGATALKLDVASTAGASGLAWPIDGHQFDLIVINAGVFGPRTSGLQTPSEADFDLVMHTNVLGAMRVIPQVIDALAPGGRLAILSSTMASIGGRDNNSGWLYRASKAALNSVLKDTATALRDRAICISLSPGWVRTDMGGEDAEIDVQTSVAGMLQLLAGLTPADNASFFDYDGQPLPW